MTSNEVQKNIKNHKGKIIELLRGEIDELSMLLVPMYQSGDFVCGIFASDFSLDGYRFIKNKYITDIVTGEKNDTLDFYTDIYNNENDISKIKCPYNVKNMSELFDLFLHNNESITVECNFDDAIDYYFGRVLSVKGNIAVMQCFDGSGVLFKEPVKVNLDFVSMVTVGDRYTGIMSKYVKW